MEEPKDKYFKIHSELQKFFPILDKAGESVRNEGISKYPIFIASKLSIELGIPLVLREKSSSKWDIYISTLEEFTTKQIIHSNKVDEFRKIYKDPETHYCTFVLSNLGAQFIFIPTNF